MTLTKVISTYYYYGTAARIPIVSDEDLIINWHVPTKKVLAIIFNTRQITIHNTKSANKIET